MLMLWWQVAVATAELTSSVEFYTVGNPGYHNVGIPGFQTVDVLYATAASLKAIRRLIGSQRSCLAAPVVTAHHLHHP